MKALRLVSCLTALVLLTSARLYPVDNDTAPATPVPPAVAQAPEAAPAPEVAEHPEMPGPPEPAEPDEGDDDERPADAPPNQHHRGHHDAPVMVSRGDNVDVLANEEAQVAVSIFADVKVEGKVREAAVSVLGSNTVNGSVGQAAVAVLGNVYVNGTVGQDVVAVLGGVELGPKADVHGQVVSIGGAIKRDAAARVHGKTVNVAFSNSIPNWGAAKAWFVHGLMLGRPLTLVAEAAWAWWLAVGFLVLYIILTLIFPKAVSRCADTLEVAPGKTLLAAFLAALLTPLLAIALVITVIGTPLFLFVMFFVSLFGKAGFLLWLGRRFGVRQPILALLPASALLWALYLIPFVGFGVMKLTDVIGTGMGVFALIMALRKEKNTGSRSPFPPAASPTSSASPETSAAPLATDATAVMAAPLAVVSDPVVSAPVNPSETTSETATPPVPPVPPVPPTPPLPPVPPAPRPRRVEETVASAPRAGFWIRLAASLIDAVVVSFTVHLVHMGDFFMLAYAAYCVLLWFFRGTTIGGIVCGLKVVRLDERPVDWSTAIVRALGGFLSLAVAGLGFIWVNFDDESQSWHDRIAGTVIIKQRSKNTLL